MSTLEGLDTTSRKGKHGGRPPVITDDMLHTVLRRRANGESVEQIQPAPIIPTGKRKGRNPSVAGVCRALRATKSPNVPDHPSANFSTADCSTTPNTPRHEVSLQYYSSRNSLFLLVRSVYLSILG
ncbi:hypothetical protein [Streptomyces sp. ML-6]|uniref:hypothetical protein n=1 Tax=Streptomyces sp. ML-6 TaxID=2982693 RepID=UPI0024C0B722|nr:hypothetical protein [Streptomyces sp. ML-6]MDK0524571.1 hypothetical protein [Streptomyces sp. ML-6]